MKKKISLKLFWILSIMATIIFAFIPNVGIRIEINLINSLFLNWRWLYYTMTIVIGILAILIFKEYKGEK